MPGPDVHRGTIRPGRPGFTLLEILVTIAIVALVAALAGAALLGTARSAPSTRLQAQEEVELIRVCSVIRRQILTIATSPAAGAPVVSGRGTEPRTDTLTLLTSSLLYSGGVGDAKWRIMQDGEEPPCLAYLEEPYVGAFTTGHHPWTPFSRLIDGMQVLYRKDNLWTDAWNFNLIPERIQVTLWYSAPTGPESCVVDAAPGLAPSPSPSPGASGPGGGSAPSGGSF